MKILFSHVNYPAQFRRLLPYLVSLGHEIVFLCKNHEWHAQPVSNLRLIKYQLSRPTDIHYCHPYLRRLESAVLEGQAAFRAASLLKSESWIPDVVVTHVGFGNGFFLKDCFPTAFRVGLVEWFYNSQNSDVDYLPNHSLSLDEVLRLRTWNAETLLELSTLDKIITPTFWQKSQFPYLFQESIHVLHEGVDYSHLSNLKSRSEILKSSIVGDDDVQVLTYVSRCFEEYRGFPQAAEVFSILLQKRPNLHIIIVGQDGTAYGNPRQDGKPWSVWASDTFDYPSDRIHWLGLVSESKYQDVLSISDVHLYLTVPFVLSWSLIEAMSVGLPIVASDTQPVREVITHLQSGFLVDFFNPSSQAEAVIQILDDPELRQNLSSGAKTRASAYSCQESLDSWASVLGL